MRARLYASLTSIMFALAIILPELVASPPAISQTTPPATPPYPLLGVESRIFAAASPAPVVDPELALARVTLDPGATIPPHEHPGTQIATITSGALTYTVLTGAISVTGSDGSDLTLRAGETITLRPGDAVVEQPGALHTARNDGPEQVVILLSTLFPTGAPRTLFHPAATPQP